MNEELLQAIMALLQGQGGEAGGGGQDIGMLLQALLGMGSGGGEQHMPQEPMGY